MHGLHLIRGSVIVRILESMDATAFTETTSYLRGLGQFFLVFAGSLLVGCVVSATSALILKRGELRHHPGFELSLVIMFGYSSYVSAEAISCSGIVALFTSGVLFGHYHVHNLSHPARESLPVALKSLGHLAETTVFAYMGVDLFADHGAFFDAFFNPLLETPDEFATDVATLENFTDPDYDPNDAAPTPGAVVRFALFALITTLCARVVVVLPLCALANRFRHQRLSARTAGVLVFAGLRGAIAFALAKNIESAHRGTITGACTAIVLFTTFVLGGFTRSVLKVLRMTDNSSSAPEHDRRSETERELSEHFINTSDLGPHRARWWHRLDQQNLQPLFGRSASSYNAPVHPATPAQSADPAGGGISTGAGLEDVGHSNGASRLRAGVGRDSLEGRPSLGEEKEMQVLTTSGASRLEAGYDMRPIGSAGSAAALPPTEPQALPCDSNP